ncbi:MAG: histidine kinase N-terminal 7TM domain-containing protein [Bacillota bacterium]|nr:histidine kinase N-terminal 7TM domain-containing protein [Bacillota bacterium]
MGDIPLLKDNWEYILLGSTTLLIVLLLFFLIRTKKKQQLHYVFISILSLLIFWSITSGPVEFLEDSGHQPLILISLSFISICLIPIPVYLLGRIYANSRLELTYKHLLLLVIPFITIIIIMTNHYNHLFYIKYSFRGSGIIYGRYFIIHAVYSYSLILIGMCYLAYSSIKNAGIFSKQSILILTGLLIPLIINILFTVKIVELDQMSTPISFTFAITCFYIAIFKFDFLSLMPIAMRTVVDRISNSFLVIDLEYRIVDFNRAMFYTFSNIVDIKRKVNLLKLLDGTNLINVANTKNFIENVKLTGKAFVFEQHFYVEGILDKYFTIEITPIMHNKEMLGIIILLTNITEHKENLKIIEEQQQQITEKERLASLGNLIGGISHNLKTPIMSISGCITALEDLSNEYMESIGNPIVEDKDHHEIANEMLSNIHDLKGHISYISNALTAIKNQVMNPGSRSKDSFTVEELILNIDFLMKYEIKSNLCVLNIINEISPEQSINGDIGTLVQIVNNLISNSIQAYEKINDINNVDVFKRKIELIINKTQNNIVFTVKDYGRGVAREVKNKLFKEMTTTKGKDGSGIGLYLSYSKIKVMFKGDMWFESEEGAGSRFYIKIQAA